MNDQHPIIPTPELVQQWVEKANEYIEQEEYAFATIAAQWGADQELEACCEWLSTKSITNSLCNYSLQFIADNLRNARRPKPPSLKRVALLQLDTLNADLGLGGKGVDLSQIRRALEALPDD